MSSRKETKVLFEGWRKFLAEATGYYTSEVQEPSNEIQDSASKKTHLAIFDFDGTLFNPVSSPVPGMQYYWGNTVASMSGTPIAEGVNKVKQLSVDHTIVILTSRAVVDKERLDKAGKKYGDIFNQFMQQQSTSELTDDIFAAKVEEILGFRPESIIRTNKEFNVAMYKKNNFSNVVNNFIGSRKGTFYIKYFEDLPKAFNAVVDLPVKIGDRLKVVYEYYLVSDSFDEPKVTKSSTEARKGETTPEEK